MASRLSLDEQARPITHVRASLWIIRINDTSRIASRYGASRRPIACRRICPQREKRKKKVWTAKGFHFLSLPPSDNSFLFFQEPLVQNVNIVLARRRWDNVLLNIIDCLLNTGYNRCSLFFIFDLFWGVSRSLEIFRWNLLIHLTTKI